MKAVILAAGLSRRLQQVTNGLPKTLLDFGGRTILDRQIDSLFAANVSEIAIVVGHAQEHILSTADHGLDPDWVEAVLFAWLARERLAGNAQDTRTITGARQPVLLGKIRNP